MIERQPHILDDFEWHPIVPKGAVTSIDDENHRPKILWIGRNIVESPRHELTEFEEADLTPVEFHRYTGENNVSRLNRIYVGEAVDDTQSIAAVVCLTGLGIGIKAIPRPLGAKFKVLQLKIPTVAPL